MMDENQIGTTVVEAAIAVHRAIGPGLLEVVYQAVLAHELAARGLVIERQVSIPVEYCGVRLEEGFRADMIVNRKVILELKSVESIGDVHKKQVLSYLKLTDLKLGYLLNFGDSLMKNGITRVVNGLNQQETSARPAPQRQTNEEGATPCSA